MVTNVIIPAVGRSSDPLGGTVTSDPLGVTDPYPEISPNRFEVLHSLKFLDLVPIPGRIR